MKSKVISKALASSVPRLEGAEKDWEMFIKLTNVL